MFNSFSDELQKIAESKGAIWNATMKDIHDKNPHLSTNEVFARTSRKLIPGSKPPKLGEMSPGLGAAAGAGIGGGVTSLGFGIAGAKLKRDSGKLSAKAWDDLARADRTISKIVKRIPKKALDRYQPKEILNEIAKIYEGHLRTNPNWQAAQKLMVKERKLKKLIIPMSLGVGAIGAGLGYLATRKRR